MSINILVGNKRTEKRFFKSIERSKFSFYCIFQWENDQREECVLFFIFGSDE
jgi:hypothetical protein